MVYRAIGLMSGSSLDGLDIVFVEFHENGGKWAYEIIHADCFPYSAEWADRLKSATKLLAAEYLLLDIDYGHYLGTEVNRFIDKYELQYKVALIGSHGHTSFHMPQRKMTAQLGDGASIAAETGLPVVAGLRSMDLALGGQGAPVVPIGERLLLGDYLYFLNLGGIANISMNGADYKAFDVCPANRVLNMLVAERGMDYDDGGRLAETGRVNEALLEKLNALDYYKAPSPKSLANDFGTEVVYPLIKASNSSVEDALCTMVEHIVVQVRLACEGVDGGAGSLLVTGGGAFNDYLLRRLGAQLEPLQIDVVVPGEMLVKYKEAMIMALMGVLRWREETNIFASVTGASRDSVSGGMWLG